MSLKKPQSNAPQGKKIKVEKIKNNSKPAKSRFSLFKKNLLLKQTLLATWKSKLQLVILLLLSTFSVALITGTFISYERIVQGANFLGLNDAQFDAVLPYTNGGVPVNQIADQAFSLHTGRLYYQKDNDTGTARYYDDTIIGQQTEDLTIKDLNIVYTRVNNKITGIKENKFYWANDHPITFKLSDSFVKASMYGQLLTKANSSSGVLRHHYFTAAQNLYDQLFLQFTAPQMLNSLHDYFTKWITMAQSKPDSEKGKPNPLTLDDNVFTQWMLDHKINYRGENKSDSDTSDKRIPFNVNLATNDGMEVLNDKLVKSDNPDPRVTYDEANYGLNGQWMRIYRNFNTSSSAPASSDVVKDFIRSYTSPSDYNMISDNPSAEENYSYIYAAGAAALQNRDIKVINQFTGAAFVSKDGTEYDTRVIDIGLNNQYNHPDLKIFEGVYPTSRNELVISPQYARINKKKPGDTITINNREFIISGIGGDAFNIYPTFNISDPIPNTRTQFLIYVYPDAFNDSSWYDTNDKTDSSVMYFLPWKNAPPEAKFNLDMFDDYFQKDIFSTNGASDSNQFDYSKYLINKYLNHTPVQSKYAITPNLVAAAGSSEFIAYNQGLSSYNSILSGFKWAGLSGVIFITLIVCFITYLIVKKAIQKAQVSLGILKSSGYSTWKIAMSYLAYPLIALIIAIPIGWIAGLALQVYFTEIFNTLFVLPYNVFNFNFIPALISIAVIIGFILVTALLTAYRMLQMPPLMLIKKDSDIAVSNSNKIGWLHAKIKHSFRLRFALSLTKTSWRKILVTGSVIGLATLAITATVSVPATITNLKSIYFQSQKYQNYYQYQDPLPNMPLSKYGLYSWSNLTNPNNEPYYPVAGVMPWPDDLIISDSAGHKLAWYNPLEYKVTAFAPDGKTAIDNNFNQIVHFYSKDDPQNQKIKDTVGPSLLTKGGNGPLNTGLITWNYSWLGGRAVSNQLIIDLAKQDQTPGRGYSAALIRLAANLLPSIVGVSNPGGASGINAISDILKQTLPGFVRQILDQKQKQDPNVDPYKYFSIGHNNIAYDPDYQASLNGPSEELVTQFKIGSDKPSLANKGFLNVVGINPNTGMLTIDSNLINELKYDSTQTTIPMVINRAFAAQYGLNVGDQFGGAPDVNTLYYKNDKNQYRPIPKANWYYGSNPMTPTSDGSKAPWNVSANKWNARGQMPIGNTGFDDSFGYTYNGVYNQDGKQVTSRQPKEWNDMNQLWLHLPSDINSSATTNGSIKLHNGKQLYFKDLYNISYNNDSKSGWIKPFSFNLTKDSIDPTDLLTDRDPEWYGAMLDQGILKTMSTLEDKNGIAQDIKDNMPDWWASMTGNRDPVHTYKVIGIQDSYDTARAFVDQKWANSILGYSYVNDTSVDKDPTYGPGLYQWFSGKMSSFEDIYDIIGRLSVNFSASDYTMYGVGGINGNGQRPLVASTDLLSRKKQMFDKMSGIAFSASAIFIITTILCSILIVVMITDLFTDQFRRFMAHMKSEGYTNWEINSFTLGIFTPWVILGYIVGFGLGILTVYTFLKILAVAMHIVLPFAFIWWLIPFSLFIIGGIYISTFIINNNQLNKMNLIELLKTNE